MDTMGSHGAMRRGRLLRGLLITTILGVAVPQLAWAQQVADEDEAMLLPTILVEGSSYETEDSGSYTTDLISVGDKDVRPLREIPQSTTVLTWQRLRDGNATSLDSAMRKTPGVMVLSNDDGRSSIYSRGFEFDSFSMNGLITPLSSLYGTQPDMAIVDHVEILRGPSGLFTGTGEPAGTINMRLKQPTEDFRFNVTGIAGSWNNRRIEADVSGALNESGTVRGRLVGAYGARDSWMDVVDNKVALAYGTIAVDLDANTTATFSLSHRKRDITPTNGLPTYADGTTLDLPVSTYTGADWNYFDNTVTDAMAEVERRFDDGGHYKLSALFTRAEADMQYAFAGSAASPTGVVSALAWLARDYTQDSFSLDAHMSRPFYWFGVENNLILGADYRSNDTRMFNQQGRITGAFDLNDWDPAIPRPAVSYVTRTDTDTSQYGLYGQWRVKPAANLTAVAGARLSWYDNATTVTTLASGARVESREKFNAEVTPYLGLIWDLNDRTSAYASFTEIFQPQTETDASGALLKPRTGRQYELGLKADLFTNTNASFALFRIEDENRAVGDPAGTGEFVGLGKARLQGVEVEVTGSITDNWEVSAGYTYTDSSYRDTDRPTTNKLEYYAPNHMLHLWTKYTFDDRFGRLDGSWIGGGIKAFSDYESLVRTYNPGTGAVGETNVRSSGYAVVDLMAGYRLTDTMTASLTVNNVLGKKYYERVHNPTNFNFYGEPRSVTFKINANF